MFIVFEGGDGSGKTSQIKLLKEYVEGKYNKKVVVLREPGGTILGEKIRGLLLKKSDVDICFDSEVFLFFASRLQLIKEVILPELDKGSVVICDRFIDSSRVYQGFMNNQIDVVDALIDLKIPKRLLCPDITFVLNIDAEIGLVRSGLVGDDEQRFEELGLDYHNKINSYFRDLSKKYNNNYKNIDVSSLSIDDVFSEIKKIVSSEILKYDNWS